MKDASILYFTRMYALVGSLREDGFHQCLKGEESRFFRYQMSKAILAIVDVMLLRKNVYDSSYKKRAKLIQSYYPDRKEFHSLVMWALQEKLYPKSSVMEPEATRELYELVLEYFIMEMYPSLSMYYNYPIRGPEDIEYCMKWKPGQIFKRIYWMIRYGKLIERNMAVHLSQSYLISSYEKNSTNNHYLSKAIDLIRSVDECIPISLSWDQARIHAAELRIKM